MKQFLCAPAFLLFAACGAAPAGAEAPQKPVTLARASQPVLYGTAWCPYCKAARSWFAANKIPYTNCDVENDAHCTAQYGSLRKQHGGGVPLIEYQGQVWRGFDENQMAEIAALRGARAH